jgi:hypothetical protein
LRKATISFVVSVRTHTQNMLQLTYCLSTATALRYAYSTLHVLLDAIQMSQNHHNINDDCRSVYMKVTSNCIVSFKTVDCNSVALLVMLIVTRLMEKVSVLYCLQCRPNSAFCYAEKLDLLQQTAWELGEKDTRTRIGVVCCHERLIWGETVWLRPLTFTLCLFGACFLLKWAMTTWFSIFL